MERVSEIFVNTNGYYLLVCITYSLICGTLFPNIWDALYHREQKSRYAAVQLIRSLGTWSLAVLICTLPGTVLAWTAHRDYGGASLLFFVIGWAIRRLLHEAKIWRAPPWF